jgi:hypothetical protein
LVFFLTQGDFLQLGPVAGSRVFSLPLQEEKAKLISVAEIKLRKGYDDYTEIEHKKKLANIDSNWLNRKKGYELYRKITYVVTLKDNWRHASNPVWVIILNRWRRGIFYDADVAYANSTCKFSGIYVKFC